MCPFCTLEHFLKLLWDDINKKKVDLIEMLEGLFFEGERSKFGHFWFVGPFSQKLTSIFFSSLA